MKGKIERVAIGLSDTATITIVTKDKPAARGLWDDFRDIDVDIDVKKHRKKRSVDANAYAWVLIGKIAFVLGIRKEEAYKSIVKDYGLSNVETMTKQAAEYIIPLWQTKGIGWQAEIIGTNRQDKSYVDVMFIVGSSAYDSAEFAKLVDAIITECKELSIPYESGYLKAVLEDEKHTGK